MELTSTFTDRQQREREYYEEYSRRNPPKTVPLSMIEGTERRPWNPYWFVAELVQSARTGPGQRLLDFGCGPGNYSVQFARMGYDVHGFDIAPHNLEVARDLAARYGVADRTTFVESTAERLPFPDAYFDVAAGIDILHHVDIPAAMRECLRVLKPGGMAVFKEPIEVPVFDALRKSAFGEWLVPRTKSFDRHVTDDERKLTAGDLEQIRSVVGPLDVHRFRLLTRVEALGFKPYTKSGASVVEIIDRWVLKAMPPLRPFGGNVVLVFRRH
jgi:2-polyprenyl-3-methyl-5-hydroxy-6-metoxy-1,4-benzoquinol methylase